MSEEATGWGGQLWAAADLVTPMTIRVAATLRLADHIAAGTQSAEALAALVDADPDALGRVMEPWSPLACSFVRRPEPSV